MTRAIPWADAPDCEKPSYAELEAEAAAMWHELAYAEDRIRELEQLVRDMQALDRMHHGPFSWERIDRMQDIRGSINARLIKMGFVEEVGE